MRRLLQNQCKERQNMMIKVLKKHCHKALVKNTALRMSYFRFFIFYDRLLMSPYSLFTAYAGQEKPLCNLHTQNCSNLTCKNKNKNKKEL